MTFQYLSFADPERPTGTQFLGAVIVEAPDFITAVMLSHALGINPGGEVVGAAFPEHVHPPARYVGRLLSKVEIDAMDAELLGPEAILAPPPRVERGSCVLADEIGGDE